MAQVQVWAWVCERCGHTWLPRDKDQKPRVCPKCKSPYWDRPRKSESGMKPAPLSTE
jgi:rubrerythrin